MDGETVVYPFYPFKNAIQPLKGDVSMYVYTEEPNTLHGPTHVRDLK